MTVAEIKRRCYAFRNGIVAEVLRKSGAPYRLILGLNLPQLVDVAASVDHTVEQAEALWADDECRESRLLAILVYPVDDLTFERAEKMVVEARSREEVDILCHRLLRRAAFAGMLASSLWSAGVHYASLRLSLNLLPSNVGFARQAAEAAVTSADTAEASVARQIMDELEFC